MATPAGTEVDIPIKDEYVGQDRHNTYIIAVGELQFQASERRDIAYATTHLAGGLSRPSELHFATAKKTTRYLACTEEVWLVMEIKPSHLPLKTVDAHSDADWAGIADTRIWTSCGGVFISDLHIGGFCKTQQAIGLSSAETDTYAGASTASLALYVATFANEIGWGLQDS